MSFRIKFAAPHCALGLDGDCRALLVCDSMRRPQGARRVPFPPTFRIAAQIFGFLFGCGRLLVTDHAPPGPTALDIHDGLAGSRTFSYIMSENHVKEKGHDSIILILEYTPESYMIHARPCRRADPAPAFVEARRHDAEAGQFPLIYAGRGNRLGYVGESCREIECK